MAIKKISEFTSGIPTSADKILFEQSGAGKSATIGDAVNTCSLTLEEIQASTDLTGKVASAGAIKKVNNRLVTATLYCTNGLFKLNDYPVPYNGYQVTVIARNVNNGSLYALWYDNSNKAFSVGTVLKGSSPNNGESIIVQYLT